MQGEKRFKVKVEGSSTRGSQHYDLIQIGQYLSDINKKDSKKRKPHDNIRTICFKKKIIEKEYPDGKLPTNVEDLINIALATFSADKIVKRDILINAKTVEGRYFTRKIKLVMPVSDVSRWNKVKHQLEKTISFMTYDIFKYDFIKRKAEDIKIIQKDDEYDSISLFSGGLDSLAGSYYLSENGHKPIFVSINHAGIGKILDNLYDILSNGSARKIGIRPEKLGSEESTQFSRSFLYLTMATSIALAHKNTKKIFVPENGIIARQIGLMEGRHGTRTAHPKFLMYYNNLINSIFPEYNLTIENPFTYLTKREIIEQIQDKSKIKNTISCAHTRFLKKKGNEPVHCGMGIPCLIRTVSLISSGIVSNENDLNVKFNPFLIDFTNPEKDKNVIISHKTIDRWYKDGLVNVLDIIRLAIEIKNKSERDIVTIYPDFLDDKVYELYKNFSENILKTVEHYQKRNPTLKIVLQQFET